MEPPFFTVGHKDPSAEDICQVPTENVALDIVLKVGYEVGTKSSEQGGRERKEGRNKW